ncbi:hypothetical protein SY83_17490 [Paenibacillus swuensis]|uniref:Uncharacterized protein n=1 Tax=Paenibacillus swuensis TaxID=1178515 RepID=A0A172TL62_9BACL|nr:hypothetical protein SY83_17490 [Paenibacillus swuensis]
MEVARLKIHTSNIELEHLVFKDKNGRRHSFHSMLAEQMDWNKSELTEESGLFRVFGTLSAELKAPITNEFHEEYLLQSSLHLPNAFLMNHPVLVIQGIPEPIFLRIETQRLEWKEKRNVLYILK